jgi:hypothetical protein
MAMQSSNRHHPSLLGQVLHASPLRPPASSGVVAERPLFLRQRAPSTQLSLFGRAGSR